MARSRLDELWDDWRQRRLVLITAGAGFGKSSFLAAGARASDRPVSWCTLDESDTDFASFGAHLFHAVCGEDNSGKPEHEYSPHESPKELLAEVIRVLRSGRAGSVLILDDAHLISSSVEVTGFLDRLIRFLPDRVTLILASREHLELSTMRLRSMGGVASLTSSDLAFTTDEIISLFHRRFPHSKIDAHVAGRVAHLTEGWAAGIEIFFQVLEGGAAELVTDALDQLKAAGSGWFPYFAEEVIARLDDSTRDFLYRSSVLPRLNATLCDEVLRIKKSRQILEQLVSRNLFTIATSESGSFRYHHIFRDFLKVQLEHNLDPDQIRKLRHKAAVALKNRGHWSEAAMAFSEAGDPEATLKLFEKVGEDLLTSGQYTILLGALENVPRNLLNKSAIALFVLGRIHEIRGQWDDAEAIYRKALRHSPPGARRADLISHLAYHKVRKGDYKGSLKLCDRALAEPGRLSPTTKGRMLTMRGVSSCDLGRVDEGEQFLQEAMVFFKRRKDLHEEARTLYLFAANVYEHRGEFRKARDAARQSLSIFRKMKNPRRICHSLGVLAWVTVAGGEIRVGRELTEEALRQSVSLGYQLMTLVGRYTLGCCDLADGDLEGAARQFEAAREMGEELGEAEFRASPHLGLAEVALARGDRTLARRYANHALDVVRGMKTRILEAQGLVILGMTYIGTRSGLARDSIAKAEQIFRDAGAAFHLHRLLLLRLDTEEMTDSVRRDCLRDLLEGAARLEHDALFLTLEPERAARVLPQAVQFQIETDYSSRLLVLLDQKAVPALVSLTTNESDEVRLRAIEILAQIGGEDARQALARAADSSTRAGRSARLAADELFQVPVESLDIHALGPLVLRMGKRVILFDRWKSKRALRLFQLLLVHRFRWVPQDLLLETFWPEADPRKAKNNLRQTVFLLRKTLEPDLKEARQSSYVRNRNEAYRLEAGDDRSFDVFDFEESLREGTNRWNNGEKEKAEKLFLNAIALYKGDYLSESPYEEVAVVEREHLRDQLLKTIQKLLTLYTAEKRWGESIPLCRRGLSLDPYNGEFYWHLVNAHCEEGNRREALTDYHLYEEMMIREMDLLPSPRMKSLAERAVLLGKSQGRSA